MRVENSTELSQNLQIFWLILDIKTDRRWRGASSLTRRVQHYDSSSLKEKLQKWLLLLWVWHFTPTIFETLIKFSLQQLWFYLCQIHKNCSIWLYIYFNYLFILICDKKIFIDFFINLSKSTLMNLIDYLTGSWGQ